MTNYVYELLFHSFGQSCFSGVTTLSRVSFRICTAPTQPTSLKSITYAAQSHTSECIFSFKYTGQDTPVKKHLACIDAGVHVIFQPLERIVILHLSDIILSQSRLILFIIIIRTFST